jgi:hypothetical protein
MTERLPFCATDQIIRRVRGEYLEMPGLRLTQKQAQRLWGLDSTACTQVLDALTEAHFLCRKADGSYARVSDDGTFKFRRPA